MQKSMLVFAMLSAATFAASAQTKISGKLACGKPEVNSSAEIPDAAGHMMMVSKASCTWPTSIDIGGAKTKTAIDVATAEVHGASGTQHGYSVAIMDNGDSELFGHAAAEQRRLGHLQGDVEIHERNRQAQRNQRQRHVHRLGDR